ncbi:MAG: hypothetical protein FGM54_01360, partial [Chitinophagaceae bacterium]|nr:hypothetical protein [Chitinophagaceae bacterium]
MKKFVLFICSLLLTLLETKACNVTITASSNAICVGQSVMLVASGANNYAWSPIVSTNDTITVSPTVTTTYTVTGSGGPGPGTCTATITIQVSNYPNVGVTAPSDTICAGSNNTMTATGAMQYTWWPGNHVGNTFNPKPESTTTYTVIGVNNPGGCADTAYKTIYVKAAPKPVLSDSNLFNPFNNCSNTTGQPNYILNVYTTSSPNITTYSLNWGDGSPTLNGLTLANFNQYVSHAYTAYGVFNLVFSAAYTNGCVRYTTIQVINQTNPSVGCTGPGNTQGCAPVQYCFKLTGYQQNSPGTSYLWNFGDGSTVLWNSVTVDSICHVFNQSSCNQPNNEFVVSVTANNLCASTTATVNNVRIGRKPTAIFTLPDTIFCVNNAVQPINVSIPASNSGQNGCNSITTYNWNYGDPLGANNIVLNTQNPPPHIYSNPGSYTITLVAIGSCGPDTMKKVVCIENNIVNFSLNNFNACAPSLVNLTNTSPSTDCSPTPYTWTITKLSNTCATDSVNDFVLLSGSYTSSTPTFRFNNQGVYRIRLSHTNKCGLVIKDTLITIKRKPKITITAPASVCFGASINPTATIQTCAGIVSSSSWSFPNGNPTTSTSANPSFTAPVGTQYFSLSATNECGTTIQPDTIQVLPLPSISISSSGGNAICNGQSTMLTVNGAAATYTWTGGPSPVNGTSITVNPNSTTTYTVTATSAQGCSATSSITITVNPVPNMVLTITPPTCVPGSDGVINVVASNGTPTYTYQLNANPFQASASFNGLSPNTYTITVKDANNCTKTSIQNIVTPNSPIINSAPQVNVSCNGGNNGSVQINATGGTGTLTYVRQPGNVSNTNGTFSGLSAMPYTITVTDASGCTASTIINITQPNVLNASLSASPVICNGQSNGSILTTATGGTPNYTYQLTPLGTTNGTGNFINLSAGNYTVTVTDSKGCTKTSSIAVTQPTPLTWASTSFQNLSCFNNATGSITVALSGGVGTYQYTRQPGNSINTTGVYNGLASGTYTITGRDANNCSISTVMTINQPNDLVFTTNVLPPTCSPGSDATLSINANGGVPAYSYQLNGNPYGSNATFTNLSAGTYTLNVKDSNNCIKTSVVNIVTPNAPIINSVNPTHVSCFGGSNGAILVNASGGTGTLSYLLQPGPITNTTGTFNGLVANTYTIKVTDASGCYNTSVVQITQPPILNAVLTPNAVTCFGQNNGSISTNASGGTSPYTYQLLPSGPSNSTGQFNGLIIGTYTVLVTDFKGCTKTATAIINQPTVLTWASTNAQAVLCTNGNSGSISVSLSGGIAPYTYTGQPGNLSSGNGQFNNLTAGTYTITGTDANGCTKSSIMTITQPTTLSVSMSSMILPTCSPGGDGILSVSGSGGIAPYMYAISPAFTFTSNATFNNLNAGTYTIQVKDANQCTASIVQTLNVPNGPQIQNIAVVNNNCTPVNIGSITITANGGTGSLQYSIQTNPTVFVSNNVFTNLANATYVITVKDSAGCTATGSATIITPNGPIINSVNTVNATCNPGCNGTIQVNATSAIALQYKRNNGPFQNSSSFSGVCAGIYTITVQDANQCTATTVVTINTQNTLQIITDSVKNITCFGAGNGKIYLNSNGGALPVTYTIQPLNLSNTNGDFLNLSPATYTITALDAAGCSQTISIGITQPTALNVNLVSVSNVSCFG